MPQHIYSTELFVGQAVKFNGNKTHIEELHGDGTALIANPLWNWEEEDECLLFGVEYETPYWISVSLPDLTP